MLRRDRTEPAITHEVEQIAAAVLSRYLPEPDGAEPPFILVERDPDVGCRRDELTAEHFEKVTFATTLVGRAGASVSRPWSRASASPTGTAWTAPGSRPGSARRCLSRPAPVDARGTSHPGAISGRAAPRCALVTARNAAAIVSAWKTTSRPRPRPSSRR